MTIGKRVKEKGISWAAAALLVAASCAVFLPAFAATADLAITQGQISFSQSQFYVGDVVRIYAKVRNLGEMDMIATVFFYQGSTLIGAAQPISLQAVGAPEEVFVDFTVPSGSFNIRAVIQGAEPADENPSNNEATTPLYTAIADADRDSVGDNDDNCENDANADQTDTDDDGQGNACDTDDDGDGISDAKEASAETDPLDTDTDDDGLNDKTDPAPLTVEDEEEAQEETASVATASPSPAVSREETRDIPPTTGEMEGASDNAATEAHSGVTAPASAYGVLYISPRAYFSYIQNDWNSFAFSVQSPQDGMTYTWDFGDGATAAIHDATHDFEGPGVYAVTLTSRDADGNEGSDVQEVAVTFWNLENPWVQALLGFFVVLLLALGVLLLAMRRSAVADETV